MTAVASGANGVVVTVNGQTLNANYVVLACDPGASATLLTNGGTANPNLVTLLQGLGNEYLDLTVVMQQNGQCWMPGQQNYWEAVNTLVDTRQQSVAFNAWFGPLGPFYDGNQQIPVFKSWGAPNLDPTSCGSSGRRDEAVACPRGAVRWDAGTAGRTVAGTPPSSRPRP